MSDEKVEKGGHDPDRKQGTRAAPAKPGDGDHNTSDRAPEVSGGQPAVGDGRPLNTEF